MRRCADGRHEIIHASFSGSAPGNLMEMGVTYSSVEMADNQTKIDVEGVLAALRPNTKVILIQRSRGYAWRASLRPEDMQAVIDAVHAARPDPGDFL